MLSDEEKKYYHKINNLDIALEETNHKYIMIHQYICGGGLIYGK